MQHVGGLSEAVPTCGIAVCLAYTGGMQPEPAASLASYSGEIMGKLVPRFLSVTEDESVCISVATACSALP